MDEEFPAHFESLTFVLQYYLPLPEDLERCPVHQGQIATTQSFTISRPSAFHSVVCGSTAEWLALPYQAYDETRIVVQPTIPCTPDLDIVKVNDTVLVISESFPECYKQVYQAIFRMRQLATTHPGYVILELVFRQPQPSGPCQFCRREDCDKLSTFLPLVVEDGSKIQCLRSHVRIQNNREGIQKGPAFTTSIPSETYGNFDTDNVDAIACPQWPHMASEWQTRNRPGKWPPHTLVDKILKTGCLVVPVSHSKSLHPDYEWRLSFSQAEVCLARSLSDVQRKCYLIVKTFFKTSLQEPAVLSTYHLKTLMFWQCEKIPENSWHKSNMAACVFGLIDCLLKSLSVKNIPHYFIPEHNLIDHIDPDNIETIKVKVENLRSNLCQHLLQGFIALMPCCVKGKTVICVKEIFNEVFKHFRTGNILSLTDRILFLQSLAEYYFILGRYGISTYLYKEYFKTKPFQSYCMSTNASVDKLSEDKSRKTQDFPLNLYTERFQIRHSRSEELQPIKNQSSKIEKPLLEFLLNMGLTIAPDPETAYDYVAGSTFSHDCDEADYTDMRNQMVRLHYAMLPWDIQDEECIEVIRDSFKRQMTILMAKNQRNLQSLAISAHIMWQLGDIAEALEKVEEGLKILRESTYPQLHFPVADARLVEKKSETTCTDLTSQSKNSSFHLEFESFHDNKNPTLTKHKTCFTLTQNLDPQQVKMYDTQYFGHMYSPNNVLFYDVHVNGLDKTLKQAIQGRTDGNPVSMPTELLMLYIRYKCSQEMADQAMADTTREEILETMERKFPYLSENDVNMIKFICSTDNKQ